MVGEISTDDGYCSVLDCTGRKQMEILQQQSCHDNKMEEIEIMNAKHLEDIIDLLEKLEDSKNDNLKYCHEIEVLQDCYKRENEEIKKQYQLVVKEFKEQLEKNQTSAMWSIVMK